MKNYITSKEACQQLSISKTTLKAWKDQGKIKFKQFSSKKILYDISSLFDSSERKHIAIYGRVSNTKQKDDLIRQLSLIRQYCTANGMIVDYEFSDIASGMNESRNGLLSLIDHVHSGKVQVVYVTYKDRLTRFGFSYFEQWFQKYGVEIVVINASKEEDYQKELVDDFISIIHHFSMKMYSNRRKTLKECKTKLTEILDEDEII